MQVFCRIVGLFGHEVGLFCHKVGLFCHKVGLFGHKVGLFGHIGNPLILHKIDLNGSGVADKAGVHEQVHAVNGEGETGLEDVVRRPEA